MPYTAGWLQAPVHADPDLNHLRVTTVSVRRTAEKLKYFAGSETLVGASSTTSSPKRRPSSCAGSGEEEMAMTDRIRVAVVGTGDWWGREHARVWSARPDSELVAVVGRLPTRPRCAPPSMGPRPTPTWTRCSTGRGPTWSPCACPTRATSSQPSGSSGPASRCWSRSRWCSSGTRPNSSSPSGERDLFFAINFNHRYARPVQMAGAAIASGELGDVVFATWRFGGEAGTSADPHANLIETQCHGFDMLEHLCGPISSVAAHMTEMTGRGFSTMPCPSGSRMEEWAPSPGPTTLRMPTRARTTWRSTGPTAGS